MSIKAMKLALEALQNSKPSNADGMLDAEAMNELWHAHYAAIDALRTAIKQAEAKTGEPYGWAVTGCHSLYRGEWAEDTARSEAKRCGGTARAFPLYTHPAPGVPEDVVKDAERYRWLRDSDHWPAPFASSQEPEPIRGADLDAAIDAAMLAAAQAQKGQP